MEYPDTSVFTGYPTEEVLLLQQLEEDRGVPIAEHVKLKALARNHVAEALEGSEPLEDLSKRISTMEDAVRPLPNHTPTVERVLAPNQNRVALSRIISIEARRDDLVRAFRREVLRGRLVEPDRLEAWVQRRAKADGEPTSWVEVPTDAERIPQEPSELNSGEVFSHRFLQYETRGAWTHSVLVADGGVLDRLRVVADHLARTYGWNPAYAVRFVLTDEPPPPRRGRITRSISSPFPAKSPITIEITPEATPEEVRDLYVQARGDLNLPSRVREISPKHAELAVFAAEHSSGYRWEHVRRKWNKQYPNWTYKDEKRFNRDARRAYRRVTGDRLFWEGENP